VLCLRLFRGAFVDDDDDDKGSSSCAPTFIDGVNDCGIDDSDEVEEDDE
jgi:hypothetical protein